MFNTSQFDDELKHDGIDLVKQALHREMGHMGIHYKWGIGYGSGETNTTPWIFWIVKWFLENLILLNMNTYNYETSALQPSTQTHQS